MEHEDARYSARGCGELFAAVITQAFHDAFAPQAFNAGEKEMVQRDSIAFLTAKSGEWRAHRNWLCTQIGIDGDALAESVREMLLGITSPHMKERQNSGRQDVIAFKPAQIEAARAVHRQMNDRSPAPRPIPTPKPAPEPVATAKHKSVVLEPDASDVLTDWYANMSVT